MPGVRPDIPWRTQCEGAYPDARLTMPATTQATFPIRMAPILEVEMTVQNLVDQYLAARDQRAQAQRDMDAAHRQLAAIAADLGNARALTNDDGEIVCDLTYPTPVYDYSILHALLEISPEVYHDAYTPAHDETIVRHTPAKWHLTKLNKWGRTLGAPVQRLIDQARLPGQLPKISFPQEDTNATRI